MFADEVQVVPANDVSESGRPIFNVSAETLRACKNSLQLIIIKARQRGLTADEAAPVAAIALPRALAVLAARPGSLHRIDAFYLDALLATCFSSGAAAYHAFKFRGFSA